MTVPVAVVIPVLNESGSVTELLESLSKQTALPEEVIFCDAGSRDGTAQIIESWWQCNRWQGARLAVLHKPGAMPGAGRNYGIRTAQSPWIAFLDGGIAPERNWLECLLNCAESRNSKAVYGICCFTASDTVARAVCALSYGYQAEHAVVPASLFHRDIFSQHGFFREDLRAAEDLIWMRSLEVSLGPRVVCPTARVHYTHFPLSLRSTAKKWFWIKKSTVNSGARLGQSLAYPLAFLFGAGILIMYPLLGVIGFVSYLIVRGIIDPLRRSSWRAWWRGNAAALPMAVAVAVTIDTAKLLGICMAWYGKWVRVR